MTEFINTEGLNDEDYGQNTYDIPETVMFEDSINILQLRVYALIRRHGCCEGDCESVYAWLAISCLVHKETIIEAIQKLEGLGFIDVKVVEGGQNILVISPSC